MNTPRTFATQEDLPSSTIMSIETMRKRITVGTILALILLSIFILTVRKPSDLFSKETEVNQTSNIDTDGDHHYGSVLFSLTVLYILSCAGSVLLMKLRVPGLLGMLLAGVLLRLSYGLYPFHVPAYLSMVLRKMAFLLILIRGGLSLQSEQLKKLKLTLPILSIVPCVVEIGAITAMSVLFGLDVWSSLAFGALLGAVSPAVVVPCMLEVERKGYGRQKGIISLLIASATLNDIFCITVFSVVVGAIFSTGRSLLSIVLHVPLEIGLGVFLGVCIGYYIFFFSKFPSERVVLARCLLLFFSSVCALFGSTLAGSESLGVVSVLTVSFFVAQKWMQGEEKLDQIKRHFGLAWHFVGQELLFSLIGFQIDLYSISWELFGRCCVVIAVGILVRTCVTFLVVRGNLNAKERLFTAIAWIPKATVQAALAPVFLELAKATDESKIEAGTVLLIGGVASILTTAPIGAFLIRITTPKLLEKDTPKIPEDEMIEK